MALPTYSKAMEKKYGKAVATKLADPSNYITRSQANAMGLGTDNPDKYAGQTAFEQKYGQGKTLYGKYGVLTGVATRMLPPTYALFTPQQGYPSGKVVMKTTEAQTEILKKNPKIQEAMLTYVDQMKAMSLGCEKWETLPNGQRHCVEQRWNNLVLRSRNASQQQRAFEITIAKQQQIIDNEFFELIIRPKLEARQLQDAQKEEERNTTIATLKMRVQELTKRPIAQPTAPAITSSLPIIPIIIIAVIVGIFLLRRRA